MITPGILAKYYQSKMDSVEELRSSPVPGHKTLDTVKELLWQSQYNGARSEPRCISFPKTPDSRVHNAEKREIGPE